MFSRFIVATDLSPASFAVVNCMGGLRALGARECLLLQCLSLQEVGSTALSYTTAHLETNLAEEKRILESQGFSVTARVVPGFAKTEINRIAAEENYSLIVVGSRGHTLMGETLLGGVASAVIHHARKPVLLVHVEMVTGQGDVCIRASRCDFSDHVLFPTDFSENADHAFEYLEEIVTGGSKRVTLFHVQDKSRVDPHLRDRLEEFNEIDRSRLKKMKALLEAQGKAEIAIEISFGSPVQEILRMIREKDVRLVVMGSQGRGFIKELFLGSVSHNVARHSEATVLLVPAKR